MGGGNQSRSGGCHECDEIDEFAGWFFLTATPAGAMSGQEFLQAFDGSAHDEATVMKPLVRQFVKEGYHNVPDWGELGELAHALILKNGYHDENVAEIAREAAIANGMSK